MELPRFVKQGTLCEDSFMDNLFKRRCAEKVPREKTAKRPMNSFLLWAKSVRKMYASENPNLSNTEISRLLGKVWKEMSEVEKLPFIQSAKCLRTKFIQDNPNYHYFFKKRKINQLNNTSFSKMASKLTSNDLNAYKIFKYLNMSEIIEHKDLKSFGYLQSVFAAYQNERNGNQNTFSPKILSKSISNNFISNVQLNAKSNKNKSDRFDENQQTHKETTTLHYYSDEAQHSCENSFNINNEEDFNQNNQIKKREDVIELDSELREFFMSLEKGFDYDE
ncbi:sex-determining region Y protein [Hydra vulgaris]|uniref:sex-determining region Y protein n=1 Tax=Hydra vulgaris TaxID=6087 RepID=UPI0001926B61|nr:sex-determining region Y protein [Hydra vulgaris]